MMAQSAMAAADFRVHLGSGGQLVFLCATFGAGVLPLPHPKFNGVIGQTYKIPTPDKGSVESVLDDGAPSCKDPKPWQPIH